MQARLKNWWSPRTGFSLGMYVVLSCRIIGWIEQKCLRSCTRHATGQRKLMNLRNICNVTEVMPSRSLAWPTASTCQMRLGRHHKQFLPQNHPRFCQPSSQASFQLSAYSVHNKKQAGTDQSFQLLLLITLLVGSHSPSLRLAC